MVSFFAPKNEKPDDFFGGVTAVLVTYPLVAAGLAIMVTGCLVDGLAPMNAIYEKLAFGLAVYKPDPTA